MMNKKWLKPLKVVSLATKICAVLFGFIAAILAIATPVLLEQEAAINGLLGVKTTEVYELPGEGVRNENYKTEYGSIKDLRAATHEVSRQAQAEGSVLLMNNGALPLDASKEPLVSFYGITSVDPVWGGTGSGQAYVTGSGSYTPPSGQGSVTFPQNEDSMVTYKSAFTEAGFTVNDSLWNWYWNTGRTALSGSNPTYRRYSGETIGGQPQLNINGETWTDIIPESAREAKANAAFFVLGRIGGEAGDRKILDWSEANGNTTKSYLELSSKEKVMLENLKRLRSKDNEAERKIDKLVLVINASNQPELDWITQTNEYDFDAVLWIGGLGQDGIKGVADLVAGKASPSGRLAVQFWNDHALNPVQANFGRFNFDNGTMQTSGSSSWDSYIAYQEGMYLGYRYAETRYEDFVLGTAKTGAFDYKKTVAYPFGYGDSYTQFSYSNFKAVKGKTGSSWDLLRARYNTDGKLLDAEGSEAAAGTFRTSSVKTPYTISLRVTNTGGFKAKEVVQVYLQRPYTDYDRANHIEKPAVEIVGFHKTKELGPGEYEDVEIVVDEKYFAAYDAYGAKTYVVTPGDYYLTAAANAHEAVNNILRYKKEHKPGSYTGLDLNKIDNSFGQGGSSALAEVFTDPVPVTAGKEINTDRYGYSDVTGLAISNLFDSVDPNRDPNAHTDANPNLNKIDYISRDNWEGTVKLIDPALSPSGQTAQVRLSKTAAWNELIQSRAYTSESFGTMPENKPASNENPMPTFGANNNLTLAMMAPIYNEATGKYEYLYDYDDPKWDLLLDQLTAEDYVRITRDGFRTTRAAASIGKPDTVEHNGPVGFIHPYAITLDDGDKVNRKRFETVLPYAEMGVTKQADGTYLPNRLIPGTDEPMYRIAPERDQDAWLFPTAFPSNILLASTFNRELVEKVGEMVGEDALWGGYTGIYGTGVNIIRSAHQGRVFEYFSEDGFLSGVLAGRWSRGVQSRGCYVYNKHLALNEQELNREGISTFVNEQTFREIYLRAFEIPISGEIILGEEYDAKCIMGAFNRVGVEYSVTCKALFTDWLRGEAGLSGFTVSDWWHQNKSYMNIAWSLLGGNSLPDGAGANGNHLDTARFLPKSAFHESNDESKGMVKNAGTNENVEVAWKMRESIKRILYTVADSNAMGGYSQNTRIRQLPVEWPNTLNTLNITAWVLFGFAFVVFLASSALKTMMVVKAKP